MAFAPAHHHLSSLLAKMHLQSLVALREDAQKQRTLKAAGSGSALLEAAGLHVGKPHRLLPRKIRLPSPGESLVFPCMSWGIVGHSPAEHEGFGLLGSLGRA